MTCRKRVALAWTGACIAATAWLAVGGPAARADVYIAAGSTVNDVFDFSRVVNDGSIVGKASRPVTFDAGVRVEGNGYFAFTHVDGVFAPGGSPGIATGHNQSFGSSSTIEIELGGVNPGFGAGFHDQIKDTARLRINGSRLSILQFGSFVPQIGDEFVVMTWQTGLTGGFGSVIIDADFSSLGIGFTQVINNAGGPGNLTLVATAVPEAGPLVLWCAAAGAVGAWRSVRSRWGMETAGPMAAGASS